MEAGLYSEGQRQTFTLEGNEDFSDVELKGSNGAVAAHRIILSTRSIFFHDLFVQHPQRTSFGMEDHSLQMVTLIVKLIYGEKVRFSHDQISPFLSAVQIMKLNCWLKFDAPVTVHAECVPMELENVPSPEKRKRKKKQRKTLVSFEDEERGEGDGTSTSAVGQTIQEPKKV